MLTEFYVDNYKSLINVSFFPQQMSLLIGLNNAGKTNLCQAIRFLSVTSISALNDCADNIGGGRVGLTNRYFDNDIIRFRVKARVAHGNEEFDFEYELAIRASHPDATEGATLQVESEILRVNGPRFDDVLLLENSTNGVRLLHEVDYYSFGKQNYVQTTAPRDATMLNRLYDLKTNALANCFKRYLGSWFYYSLSPEAIRGSFHHPQFRALATDGGNLGSMIYQLKTSDERRYRQLLQHLRVLDDSIEIINFVVPTENSVFMFFEDSRGSRLPARNASSGTLRYLGLLFAMVIQPQYNPNGLVIVEEPENGVYIAFLKTLLEATSSTSQSQFIFTSHSPYFIDLFDTRLDSLFVIKRGEGHSMLFQPNEEKVRKRLEEYPLGEQHFREMLT